MKNVTVLIHGVDNAIIGVFNTREKAIRTGIKFLKHTLKESGENYDNIEIKVEDDRIIAGEMVIILDKYHLNRLYMEHF